MVTEKKDIDNINGTTHVIREDIIPMPDMKSKTFFDFSFFEAHGYLGQRLQRAKGVQLHPLPFFGVIYTVHKNNTSSISEILSFTKLRTVLKYLLCGRRLTRSIRDEFNVINLKTFWKS